MLNGRSLNARQNRIRELAALEKSTDNRDVNFQRITNS